MTRRKAISKRTRFEVFKRDLFSCQYCGRTPPAAVLEIDHVIPVADGGENERENLLTSCMDCNRGKGAESLSNVPQSLADTHAALQEREDQIREYKKILSRKKGRETSEIKAIEAIFSEIGKLTPADRQSIRTMFMPRLMSSEIEEAMQLAVSRKSHNPDVAWKYFCGVCWKMIRNKEGTDE